ncbi:MAG: hypothetical protein ACYC91_20345 [Solirubrobacteraceae bacterium]
MERRRVTGLFGTVEITRPRVECVPCATSSYPADQRLGLEAGERYSLGVAEAALWLATDVSYAKSSAAVHQLLDIGISHGQIHRLAQREGQLVADAWEGLRQRVFGDGDRSVLADLDRDVATPALAVIQADGTFVHDRGDNQRMEAKGGIVYTGIAGVSTGRRRLLGKRTFGSLEEMSSFGEKLALTPPALAPSRRRNSGSSVMAAPRCAASAVSTSQPPSRSSTSGISRNASLRRSATRWRSALSGP